MENKSAQVMTAISAAADPGTRGFNAIEVPGNDCSIVSGGLSNDTVKPADQVLATSNSLHVKGWAWEKLALFRTDHKDQYQSIDIRHALISGNGHKAPSKAHKAASPRSVGKRKHVPPPMSAFEVLLPPLPSGYQRKIIKAPSGALGIRVQLLSQTKYLRLYEVTQRSSIGSKVRVGDIIEGVDDLYQKAWTVEEFVKYCKDNADKPRYLHMLLKKDTAGTSSTKFASRTTIINPVRKVGKGTFVLQKDKQGLFVQPSGQERKGMEWDAVRGLWVSCGPKTI